MSVVVWAGIKLVSLFCFSYMKRWLNKKVSTVRKEKVALPAILRRRGEISQELSVIVLL